jgi:pimeloyl-ACP methyl ester carboxylesterase
MTVVLRLLAAVLAAYLLLCAAMFVFQRRLQYHPDPGAMNPAAAGLPQAVQETLATPDGERIVVWWVAPRAAGKPVYLYLHGNGAHLHARALRLARLVEDGAGLMAVSWRGYGGSTGSPSEAGLLTDARTAHAELRRRAPDAPLVIYGESLGSTVATMLAAETPPAGLLLDSSFASALAVARDAYPWLPVALLLRDAYRADLAAPKVRAPVLQVHCRLDPVTPFAQAQALNALFPQRQELVVVERACHVPSLADYLGAWRQFVDTGLRRSP